MQDLPLSGFADDSLTSAARTAQTVTFTSKKDNDAAAAIALTPNATTGAWDYTQTANGDHSDEWVICLHSKQLMISRGKQQQRLKL